MTLIKFIKGYTDIQFRKKAAALAAVKPVMEIRVG
jgi:hypothetical protein